MIRSNKSILAFSVAAGLAFAGHASACQINAWDAVGANGSVNVLLADAVAVQAGGSRYSGSCALRLAGASKFVQNTIATPRTTYRARFYVRKDATGSASKVFAATNAGGTTEVIGVTFTGTTFSFNLAGAAAPASLTVPSATAWYSVELEWAQSGQFLARVTGANGQTSTPATSTATVSTTETIGRARLGNTNAAAVGNYFFDEFDSRTTQSPGRLTRGDSNGNGTVTIADATQAFNEAGGSGFFAVGQPDCNENGSVTVADASCAFVLATQ